MSIRACLAFFLAVLLSATATSVSAEISNLPVGLKKALAAETTNAPVRDGGMPVSDQVFSNDGRYFSVVNQVAREFPREVGYDVFASWGYKSTDAIAISDSDLADCKHGSPITLRPGSLVFYSGQYWAISNDCQPALNAIGNSLLEWGTASTIPSQFEFQYAFPVSVNPIQLGVWPDDMVVWAGAEIYLIWHGVARQIGYLQSGSHARTGAVDMSAFWANRFNAQSIVGVNQIDNPIGKPISGRISEVTDPNLTSRCGGVNLRPFLVDYQFVDGELEISLHVETDATLVITPVQVNFFLKNGNEQPGCVYLWEGPIGPNDEPIVWKQQTPPPGDYLLEVVVDSGNCVNESSELDNYIAVTIIYMPDSCPKPPNHNHGWITVHPINPNTRSPISFEIVGNAPTSSPEIISAVEVGGNTFSISANVLWQSAINSVYPYSYLGKVGYLMPGKYHIDANIDASDTTFSWSNGIDFVVSPYQDFKVEWLSPVNFYPTVDAMTWATVQVRYEGDKPLTSLPKLSREFPDFHPLRIDWIDPKPSPDKPLQSGECFWVYIQGWFTSPGKKALKFSVESDSNPDNNSAVQAVEVNPACSQVEIYGNVFLDADSNWIRGEGDVGLSDHRIGLCLGLPYYPELDYNCDGYTDSLDYWYLWGVIGGLFPTDLNRDYDPDGDGQFTVADIHGFGGWLFLRSGYGHLEGITTAGDGCYSRLVPGWAVCLDSNLSKYPFDRMVSAVDLTGPPAGYYDAQKNYGWYPQACEFSTNFPMQPIKE